MMKMYIAAHEDKSEILALYKDVIDHVNRSSIRLGWNIDIYPDPGFIDHEVDNRTMLIWREDSRIIAAAAADHTVNPEYDSVDWDIKEPKDKISTIHALAVHPEKQGSRTSYSVLSDIEDHCRKRGDTAIHLDVIDGNIPAYKLYSRNGYKEMACIRMYYEVVGTRDFYMMEKIL